MRRKLFNLAVSLSAALLIATAMLWCVVAYHPIYRYAKDSTGPLIVSESN